MMDEELKDQEILIDGKEAKRQFLEELRNKNEEENRKAEEEKNNAEEEEKKQFLEEVRKNVENKKLEEKKTSEDDSLNVENKDIVDNDDESKGEISEDKIEDNNPENNNTLEAEDLEENKEENVDTDLLVVGNESTEKKGKSIFDGIIKSTLIDTAITAIASLLGVYIFDLLLRLICGYYVVDFEGVYIIIFLIILVIYPIIMHHSKQGKTLGQKIGKMEVKEREE